MPVGLDFEQITEPFRRPYRLQLASMSEGFRRLGEQLARRVDQADAIERNSRDFPVVRFHGDAVTVWLDPIQRHALAPDEPSPGFGAHLTEGARRLWSGLGQVARATEDALILPRFLAAAHDGLAVVTASMDRFASPFPAMFDPRARTASDLFGEAALGITAMYASRSPLSDVLDIVVSRGARHTSTETILDRDAVPGSLENGTRLIVGTVLLLLLVPEFVGAVWKEAALDLRGGVLKKFAWVEEQVLGFRRSVIEVVFVDSREIVRHALAAVTAAAEIVTSLFEYYADVTWTCLSEWKTDLVRWFDSLALWISRVVSALGELGRILDDLLALEVVPRSAGAIAAMLGVPAPTLSLGELADPATRAEAYGRLTRWLDDAIDAVSEMSWLLGAGLRRALRPGVQDVLGAVFLTDVKVTDFAETGAFGAPLPPMPDLVGAFTAGAGAWPASLSGFSKGLVGDLKNITSAGVTVLDGLARRAGQAATEAAAGGSVDRYLAIWDEAGRLVDLTFGDDAAVLRARAARDDVVAQTFERWLALGGLEVVGGLVPGYVASMQRVWEENIARDREATVQLPDVLPTSPHILALKPRLGKTLVRDLRLHAHGRPLDDALAAEVATAFRAGIADAHRRGQAKLETMLAVKSQP